MFAKPKLTTVSLTSPPGATPVTLSREVTVSSATPFEGQPDPRSPAQRTLHQALVNRLIGQANVYNWLREFAFRSAWGFQPADLPGVTITLAIAHQSHGPKFAIVVKGAQWSTDAAHALLDQGWHVLVLDTTSLVQTPEETINDVLAVVQHFAGLPFGSGGVAADAAGAKGRHPSAAEEAPSGRHVDDQARRTRHIAKSPVKVPRKRRSLRLPVLLVLGALVAVAAGLYAFNDRVPVSVPWTKGAEYKTKVKAVEVSKEGHAVVTLGDGRKAFVPVQEVRQNPNLLHDLIVAWRQGRSLNVFTTNKQHLKYGREIEIKASPKPKPTAAKKP
jgi:hypothetical protein